MIKAEEVQELYDENRLEFKTLYGCFDQDDKYYELDFLGQLGLPKEQADKGVVLPTARSNVDTFADYIDIANARVSVSRHGSTKTDDDAAEALRKFGAGIIFMTNVEGIISPWRVAAKHYPKYGVAWLKTVYDADLWPDKPDKNVDEWLDACKGQLPIVISAVNPQCIMFDTATMGRTWVMEIHDKKVKDVLRKYEKWKKPAEYGPNDSVKHISYWDKEYRCDLIDGQPVLKIKGGVARHKYGFVPFVGIDAGLGDVTKEGDLGKRFVGINRYLKDVLRSQSRDYSIVDIIVANNAWPAKVITGPDAANVPTNLDLSFGTVTPIVGDIEVKDMIPVMAPDQVVQHSLMSGDIIDGFAIPRSLRGQSESGVRSGADRRQILSAAQYRLRYSEMAFKHRTSQVLNNCARLLQILPGDVRVYSHTPSDEFEDIIDRTKIKEPINFFVTFSPISEEDEYRRHDDYERMIQSGLVTREWARDQMPNVNKKDLERQEMRDRIKNSPAFQQFIDQTLAAKLQEVFAKRQAAEGSLPAVPPAVPQNGPSGPPPQAQGIMPPMGSSMNAPVRQVPPLGSAAAIRARLKGMRSQTPMAPGQGFGGGGARGPNR